jgi:two-component system, OmpR family, sensor histidine kinase VicK
MAREKMDAEDRPVSPADYRQLFELAPDPYIVTDLSGNILEANAASAGLLRVPAAELPGLPLLQFIPSPSKPQAVERLSSLRNPGSMEEWEGQILPEEGDPVPVWFRVGGVPPEQGATQELRWLVRDVTEGNRGRQALQDSELRLKMLHTLKDTFLQSVSHDLRSPLAAVIGLAQTLVREDVQLDRAEMTDLLQRILKSAYQMKALLTDLLDLDRLRGGYLGTMDDVVDLDQLGKQAYGQLESHRQRGVELVPSGLFAKIDRAVLERIVVNLLDNALRYTTPGGRVWLGFQTAGGGDLILYVDDDGPGVEEGSKEAIFDPFVRVAASPSVAGTGIGLALVERFARLLGGRAWVEDRPGGGASFKVLLPRCLDESLPATE